MKKTRKRVAAFLVMLSILCSMIVPTVPISGAEVDQSKWITSGIYQYEILDVDKKTITIWRINSSEPNIEIPKMIDGYTVVSLGGEDDMWDAPNVMGENSLSLKSLKIPDTVKNIGPCAFMNCSNLERVDFPKTAYIKLCRFAFCYCNKLKEITLYGANVGVFCFLIEKKLKRIELNDVNTYYFGDGAANHFTEANTIVLNGNTECWLSHFHLDSHVNRIFLNDSATLNWGDILTTVGRVYVNGIFSKITYDIVNITLHFFLKDVRPMLPLVMKHSTSVA